MKVEITRIGGEECAACSSLDIAETFGKAHRGVLRDIRELDCSENFNLHNFVPITYTDDRGREQPYYLITRDGFTFLVMGYTGEKAAQFKEAYIEQFNRMERELRRKQMETLEPALRCLLDTLQTMCGDSGKEVLTLPMASDFFKYFNSFQQWLTEEHPSKGAAFLYMKLFCMFNNRTWREWALLNTQELIALADVTNKVTAYRVRDELVQAGLLEYTPGKKGKPSSYRLLVRGAAPATPPAIPEKNPEETPPAKLPTEPKPQPEKAKAKPKQEPPPAPSNAPQPHDVQQRHFDEFWQRYPRKVGKIKALAAWKKLQPDAALYERILQAIERAKQSDQWQKDNGQFIPHPTTWLNRGGWDDELQPAPVAPANNMKGDITNGNYQTANGQPDGESGGKVDALGLPVL